MVVPRSHTPVDRRVVGELQEDVLQGIDKQIGVAGFAGILRIKIGLIRPHHPVGDLVVRVVIRRWIPPQHDPVGGLDAAVSRRSQGERVGIFQNVSMNMKGVPRPHAAGVGVGGAHRPVPVLIIVQVV